MVRSSLVAFVAGVALGCAAPPPAPLPLQHQAIESDDLERLRQLLAEARGGGSYERESPLHRAARRRDATGAQAVEILLQAGVDPNHPGGGDDALRWRPLYYAVDIGNVESTRLLLAAGADPDVASEDPRRPESALEVAVRGPDPARATQVVAVLLEHGAAVERSSYRIKRALCGALRERNQTAVALLVRAGARTDCVDEIVITEADRTLYTSMVESARTAEPGASAAPVAPARPQVAKRIPTPVPPAEPPTPSIPDVAFGSYHALVIGNDEYRTLPRLGTAISDARAIAELLGTVYDFRVETLLNATRSDLMSALTRYRKHLGPQDNLLIYYAGHGWHDRDAGESYWLPTDAEENDPTYWISNATIATSLRAMRAKHVLLVADSCYSGTLTRGIRRGADSGERHALARLAGNRARTALTSGGVEPVEDDAGNGHSVFANALMRSLRSNTGVLAGVELFTSIRRPVMLGSDQTPQYGDIRKAGHEDGEFLFVRRSRP